MSYNYNVAALDDQTVLHTYAHPTQKLPFRVQVKRIPNPNPQFGNWFNFVITELNLGVEKTISQAQLIQAIQAFGDDQDQLANHLFVGEEGFITSQEQIDKVVLFSNANPEYKQFKVESAGLTMDQVDEGNWLEALLAEFCFFLAETMIQVYVSERRSTFDEMNR